MSKTTRVIVVVLVIILVGVASLQSHGHNPGQMPIAVCWDLSKNRKIKLRDTNLAWRFFAEAEDTNVRVYVLSHMPNIRAGRVR